MALEVISRRLKRSNRVSMAGWACFETGGGAFYRRPARPAISPPACTRPRAPPFLFLLLSLFAETERAQRPSCLAGRPLLPVVPRVSITPADWAPDHHPRPLRRGLPADVVR